LCHSGVLSYKNDVAFKITIGCDRSLLNFDQMMILKAISFLKRHKSDT